MAQTEQEIAQIVTQDNLVEFAPDIADTIAAALVRDCPTVFVEKEIDTPVRIAHFFAQIFKETNGLRRLDENMNYTTVAALRGPWIKFRQMSDAEAETYLHNPQKLAKFIYAGRNGNGDEASGDGWTYRGSGLIQVTGRGNFERVGAGIGMDLVGDPDQVRSPNSCVKVAASYWEFRNINPAASNDSPGAVDAVTALVNPFETAGGKADRRSFYNDARAIFT